MRGLDRIPDEADLAGAYDALAAPGAVPTVADLLLWARWTRFDPRLGELWVEHLAGRWESLPPVELQRANLALVWPQALGVLLDTAALLIEARSPAASALFAKWAALVLHGVTPAPGETYTIGLVRFAGPRARREAEGAIDLYRRWGYLGRDVMINKFRPRTTRLGPEQRRTLLDDLVARQGRIRVEDYRAALGGWIGARQAERDLGAHPRLKALGRTRSRVYLRK